MTIPETQTVSNTQGDTAPHPDDQLLDDDFGLDLLDIPARPGTKSAQSAKMSVSTNTILILVLTAVAAFALGMLTQKGISGGGQAGLSGTSGSGAAAVTGDSTASAPSDSSVLQTGEAPSLLPNSTSGEPSFNPASAN